MHAAFEARLDGRKSFVARHVGGDYTGGFDTA
jgi:hypothetical protein